MILEVIRKGSTIAASLLLASALFACSVVSSSEGLEDSIRPGSLLRETAGMPASISEGMTVSSDYIREIDDAIAVCMRLHGFEYFPAENESENRIAAWGFEQSTADYAEEFGFGIASGVIVGFAVESEQSSDYLRSLTPDKYTAYRVALEGEDSLKEPGSSSLKIGGCRREARDSVKAPPWYDNWEWFDAVGKQLAERMSADPRIIEIEEKWIKCMATLGYDGLTSVEELSTSLHDEFIQHWQTFVPLRDFNDGHEFLAALDDESKARFEAFRAKEIELAVASYECSFEDEATVAAISREIEQSIIESNPLN